MYNEDGSLKGIYNVNNELVKDCVLNDRGVLSKVTKLPNGLSSIIDVKNNSFKFSIDGYEDYVER